MNGFEKVQSCRKLRDFGENPLGPLRNNWNTKNQIPKNDALKSFSWPWNLDNPFPAEQFCKDEFFKIVLNETVEALTCALCVSCASKGEAMCGRPEAETFTIRQGYT